MTDTTQNETYVLGLLAQSNSLYYQASILKQSALDNCKHEKEEYVGEFRINDDYDQWGHYNRRYKCPTCGRNREEYSGSRPY